MRKILLFQNVSLDGYFEGPGHDISGFKTDFEAFPAGSEQEAGTLLFGHRTYEMMKFWGTPQAVDTMPGVAKYMNEALKIVASHAPFEPGWKNVRVISGDVIGAVKALKAGPGKDIMMFGSNELCVSLMQAGLMDELQIVVNPVVFGAGTPLFQGLDKKTELALVDTRRFKSGAVMLRYVAG
jgi:dihydrofolate reductase